MTATGTFKGSAVGGSAGERASRVLRDHAIRTERQLHELESDLVGLSSDRGTIQEDLDGTRRLIEAIRSDLNRTQRALARVTAGTFGLCTSCKEPIAAQRLAAIPESERCKNCA
ncbi:MAG: TraR/DksA C4-type zinc finger protein [Ilumatobacter sp.]|uniref:TraR/DksA family transcriptional regulator n=1 Tax=Ilumatobacter sp. TaxID=1967498 RepID=UPI003C72F065